MDFQAGGKFLGVFRGQESTLKILETLVDRSIALGARGNPNEVADPAFSPDLQREAVFAVSGSFSFFLLMPSDSAISAKVPSVFRGSLTMAISPKEGRSLCPRPGRRTSRDFVDSDRLSFDQAGSREELVAKGRAFPKEAPKWNFGNIRFADQGFRLDGQDEKGIGRHVVATRRCGG